MDCLCFQINAMFAEQSVYGLLASFHISTRKLYAIFQSQSLKVNEQAALPTDIVHAGDSLTIDLSPWESLDFIPEAIEVKCLFEDDWVYVLDKLQGIIIHPETKSGLGTLANQAAYFLQSRGLDRNVRYLHRLDKDTTGAILFAKNFLAHSFIDHFWNHEDVAREYLALVEGRLNGPGGRIDLPIGKDRHHNNRYVVTPGGKKASTSYEVVATYSDYTLVKVILETGRTHQIRVHMAKIGHPLLGDQTYGASRRECSRVMLHSAKISFLHPLTRETMTVEAPLPEDFRRLIG